RNCNTWFGRYYANETNDQLAILDANPLLPKIPWPIAAAELYLHARLLDVYIPGDREIWHPQRRLAWPETDRSLPSLGARRVRSRAVRGLACHCRARRLLLRFLRRGVPAAPGGSGRLCLLCYAAGASSGVDRSFDLERLTTADRVGPESPALLSVKSVAH